MTMTTAAPERAPANGPPPDAAWHQQDRTAVIARLDTDPTLGLTPAEAARRLVLYGPNALVERGTKSVWWMLWDQLRAGMVIILLAAAAVAVGLGDYADAAVILAIVVLNAALGVAQEYRATQALAALRRLAVPTVRVRRAGLVQEIPAATLVLGDLVLLDAGARLPADGRVLVSANLRVQEAALTGESAAVEKDSAPCPAADLALGDRLNMVYQGTAVVYGRGEFVVTATGMATELGRIATLLQTTAREPTPLQRRLDQVSRGVAGAALALVAVIVFLGLLRGEDLGLLLLTGVSVAVAAVPEGLPAVATVVLALGAGRMLRRQALIRRLPAVETLGSVTVICSDKTGTLTANRMTVTVLDVAGHRRDLAVPLHEDALPPTTGAPLPRTPIDPGLALLLAGGVLCNDAVVQADPVAPGTAQAVGDPTEVALALVAAAHGWAKADLDRRFPRCAELPFDAARKRMTTIHTVPPAERAGPLAAFGAAGAAVAITKGAVDGLLAVCATVWAEGRPLPLDAAWRARISAAQDGLAAAGLRVLGVAFRPLATVPAGPAGPADETGLTFVGLAGLRDPLRPEVVAAVQTCRAAGIRLVLITGDHPLTARAIAQDLGLPGAATVLTGADLDRMTPAELTAQVAVVSAYARVTPEHKLRVVAALQAQGQVVAMTGDGVNDAPALKKADIGVAMGRSGTAVAQDAADLVLLDDNFATIVAAVEEGRVIYANIRKFLKYILAGNISEVGVMLLGPLLGMPLALLPLQILWINLVTDGLPALALGLEPAERATMQRPPAPPTESVFGRGLGRDIAWMGGLSGLLALGVGYAYWQAGAATWQTLIFCMLTFSQMALALGVRGEYDSFWRRGWRTNPALLGAVLLTVVLQLGLVYLPPAQALFHTAALPLADLALCLGLSGLLFGAVEGHKAWRRAALAGEQG